MWGVGGKGFLSFYPSSGPDDGFGVFNQDGFVSSRRTDPLIRRRLTEQFRHSSQVLGGCGE